MLAFLKKKIDHSPTDAESSAPRDLSEFIPYYAHYNPTTLLTKNGEVMQIIKISHNNRDLTYESGESDGKNLRDYIRKAFVELLADDRYAFWIHTIRRRKNVRYSGRFDDPFAAYMQAGWKEKNQWKNQYYNEIYISILHEGQNCALTDTKILRHVAFPQSNRNYRNQYLDKSAADLDKVVDKVLTHIRAEYRAERLAVVERMTQEGDTAFYSEPVEFLGTLANLRSEQAPVCEMDISRQLHSHNVTFGFNALESKSAFNQRRFASILSLKQYREITPAAADQLLQAPIEFIISQAITFTPATRALKGYESQRDIFLVSGDSYSITASGLDDMLIANRGKSTDYVQMQTTVMVMADEYKNLDGEIRKVQNAFGDMGLITVREDLKLEECFWSQLPGNFEFIRRKDVIPTPRAAGFCRLNLYPDGQDSGNHWGEAVTLLPTQVNSPYFFNFHHQDNGHTLIFDFNAFRDSFGQVVKHFLLTSATKYNGRLFVFDRHHASYLWFDKIKGRYHRFQVASKRTVEGALRLNPFSLEDTKRNRGFLLAWCNTLVAPHFTLTEAHKNTLETAIASLYAGPQEQRNLHGLVDGIAPVDYQLAAAFHPFLDSGKYAGIFDAAVENFSLQDMRQAFDLERVARHTPCTTALFAYLMHRIITVLDGKPGIIVLNEGFDLLNNDFFAPRLESLMDMLTQNNVMLICTTQQPETSVRSAAFEILVNKSATHMYLPDDISLDYTAQLPCISAHENALLSKMDRRKGDFLIRQRQEDIALRINLAGMDDIRAIFSNDAKTLIAAGGKFAALPPAYGYADD